MALVTTLIFFALATALLAGTAPGLNTQLVALGERAWPGYAADLRAEPEEPGCELEALRAELDRCPAEAAAPVGDDPFGGEDPFAGDDPFGGEDPFAGGDPFADPVDQKPQVNCAALTSLVDRCATRHANYRDTLERITPGVRAFRVLEGGARGLSGFKWWKHLLSLLLLLGAFAATARGMHIALREPRTPGEHRVAQGAQLLAHLLWLASCVADRGVQRASSAEPENAGLPLIWAAGFAALAAVNLLHLARPPKLEGQGGGARALMVIPLYAYMAAIAGAWFLLGEHHSSGQAIYLHKFVQHPSVYIGIGLYIWAGMLLAETRLARLAFDLLAPWGLPVTLLAWLAVVLSAVPTAYSGASGIFVIAAGAVIFERLRAAGASPRIALAATAMSGSLGVVLRPCLVVVLVAVLNKQVTTDELFSKGLLVFALTAVLTLVAMLARNREPIRFAPLAEAAPQFAAALKALAPYGLIAAGVLIFDAFALGLHLNEHTTPVMLPVLLLALVVFERRAGGGVWSALKAATSEASSHVGALLMLMVGSVGLGGVVERAELMSRVAPEFSSLWVTMAALVVVMVLVGMTMDALGAVILVSVSVAGVAYDSGVDPVHFWMVVLVAFELGYLTPPVAINHLLARQVIGADAQVELHPVEGGFLARYEHVLLPMAVMGTALLLVAFVPLLWY